MLLSLRQTLLQSCPVAMTLDILGATLQPAAHCITAKYSRLQPSEAWQARLAADVRHIVQTCRMMTQPVGHAGRCGYIIPDIDSSVGLGFVNVCGTEFPPM